MSYLVLARKYRPKTFADVVGQDHVVRPLANALKAGRIAHAYLFAGARGVGKTTCARLLAMALNCRAGEVETRPCGECESCREIIEGHAVDVYEIDGASNRRIEEIRNLRETVKYLPSKSRLKVYIIDEVHMLTKEAFNALLKTLEEPPDHVVFIFATTETHKVLPTILSRCQRYDFQRIGVDRIVGRLEQIAVAEKVDAAPGALRLIARESEGCLRDALSLFDQVIAFSGMEVREDGVAAALGLIDQTLIADLVGTVLTGRAGDGLEILDRVYNFGYDLKDFATQVLEYHRALVVAKVSTEPGKILDLLDAELADVKKTAAGASLETLNFLFNAWLEVQNKMKWAAHPRLVLEALIVRLAQAEPLQSLAELTARLEGLLERLGGSGGGSSSNPPAGNRAGYGGGRSGGPPSGSRFVAPEIAKPEPEKVSEPPSAYERETTAPPVEAEPSGPKDWNAFVRQVLSERPIIGGMLANQTEVHAFEEGRVELTIRQKNAASMVDKETLAGLLAGFFGRRPKVEIRFEEAKNGGTAAAPSSEAPVIAVAEDYRREILEHPLVKEAQRIFSAEVLDVKPER